MGTALVTVRKGLVTKIAALPTFATAGGPADQRPLVTFGYKVGARERERVWTQDARFTHAPASLRAGKTFRDEVGRFSVRVLVEGVGLSPEQVSQRAVDLGTAIEDLVATHATWQDSGLGAALTDLVVDGDGQLVEAFNDRGSLAELTYPIRYRARLT